MGRGRIGGTHFTDGLPVSVRVDAVVGRGILVEASQRYNPRQVYWNKDTSGITTISDTLGGADFGNASIWNTGGNSDFPALTVQIRATCKAPPSLWGFTRIFGINGGRLSPRRDGA